MNVCFKLAKPGFRHSNKHKSITNLILGTVVSKGHWNFNEMDNAFRKIDIDIYDEDVLQESELYVADQRDASQALAEAKLKQAAVRASLAR